MGAFLLYDLIVQTTALLGYLGTLLLVESVVSCRVLAFYVVLLHWLSPRVMQIHVALGFQCIFCFDTLFLATAKCPRQTEAWMPTKGRRSGGRGWMAEKGKPSAEGRVMWDEFFTTD